MISSPSRPLRFWRKITGPGELSLTPIATASSRGEISTRMIADSTMSSRRLTSWLVPVKGVSHMPTMGTPFRSCSRPWMIEMPKTSGTKKIDAVVPCNSSSSSTMRGCEPRGKVM
jgi:hypothetical protein